MPSPSPRFSVVEPTLNEAGPVARTLAAAREAMGPDAEIIVSDGGSVDGTRGAARLRAHVIDAPTGRGAQLNAGAEGATGQVLVFLHADTRLEPGCAAAIDQALADPRVAGGCCRFAVDPPAGRDPRYRLLEAGVNLRTRLFRTATGDQVIFARRDAFRAAGGFPEVPLFEDVGLARRLRSVGRFRVARTRAFTSRRRWERRGFWRTVFWHWALRLGHAVGISPRRLARWYR